MQLFKSIVNILSSFIQP